MINRDDVRMNTLPEMFNRAVLKYGERPLQWFKSAPGSMETEKRTYAQAGTIVRDLAAGLMSLGIVRGDRVAVMAHNCPEWLWADFAVLGCGAATVTIYPTFSAREMQYIINNSGSKIMFVRSQDCLDKVQNALSEMPSLQYVVVMDDQLEVPSVPTFMNISAVREAGRKFAYKNPYCYDKACDSIKIWDIASIIYTSGTTGEPKGAIHTHSSFVYANCSDINMFNHNDCMLDEFAVCLSFLPLSHSYERQCGQMMSIMMGHCIAYAESPQTVVGDIFLFKPTWFCAVPRIFERIYMALRDAASASPEGKAAFERAMEIGIRVVDFHSDEDGFFDASLGRDFSEGLPEELKQDYLWADQNVFSKIRGLLGPNFVFAFSASASLSANLCKSFLAMGIRVVEGYGLTETMNAVNFSHVKAILPGSMGPTNYYAEEKIAPDGELLVRGGMVFQGYFNNPQATAEAFDEEGFFHTGDIAVTVYNKSLGVNYYKIIDRKKNIMVLDTGKNVPRAKVEGQFATSRFVEQVCTVGDDRKYVGAIVVPKFEAVLAALKARAIEFEESLFKKEEGLIVEGPPEFADHPEVVKLLEQEISDANANLEDYERIKKFRISPRKFLQHLDEITPTLKTKHRKIQQNFAREVEKIFKDDKEE